MSPRAVLLLPIALAAGSILLLPGCETGPSYSTQLRDPGSSYYTGGGRGGYDGETPSSSAIVNQEVLDRTDPSNARIEISLGEQKARLYRVAGGSKELAIETRISTGREGRTPVGTYSVLEKLRQKNSSLYGSWVDGQSGALIQGDGDSRNRPAGGNAEFQGSPMPYWLRITRDGVGMHVGYVPNHPASHGCIRVPNRIQPLIWERVAVGTPIDIRA
ncbi:MAG: L,D-transpeptidase family protein [Verrucomicrobiales bacterium]|nr:L,D-transpeptidase family protein [Verrucomicrobiales bacterium]